MGTFDFIGSVAKRMLLDFEASKEINHNGIKGTVREESLRDFLIQYLPKKYSVGTGVIVNEKGIQSKQQDIFVYDSYNSPVLFNTDSIRYMPIESIYSTIEVKSTLAKKDLEQAVENIQSVKRLVFKHYSLIPSGFIFAYQSKSSLEKVCENLIDMNKNIPLEYRVNAICILNEGLIMHLNGEGMTTFSTCALENHYLSVLKGEVDKNLIFFYLLLLEDLKLRVLTPPNFLEYAGEAGILSNHKYSVPKQEFKDNVFVVKEDGEKIFIKDQFK